MVTRAGSSAALPHIEPMPQILPVSTLAGGDVPTATLSDSDHRLPSPAPTVAVATLAEANPAPPTPSTARSMRGQTSGSFTQAGGSPTNLKGKKKAKQEELAPDDSAKVIELGLSAFIPKQDAMSNQNRLVLNEVIMAELLLDTVKRLSRDEDARNSQHKEAVTLIADLKASVRTIGNSAITEDAFPNLHSRPEFDQLYNFCREGRDILNKFVLEAANDRRNKDAAIQKLRMEIFALTARVDDIVAEAVLSPAVAAPATPSRPNHADHSVHSSREGNTTSMGASSNTRMPPTTNSYGRGASVPKRGRGGNPARGRGHPYPRQQSRLSSSNATSLDVAYGPVSSHTEDPTKVAADALTEAGLSPSMFRSVQFLHGQPDFISIRFIKPEYAKKFIDLAPYAMAVDGAPQIVVFYVDEWDDHQDAISSVAGPSNTRSQW